MIFQNLSTLICLSLIAVTSFSQAVSPDKPDQARPNFVVILADDLGYNDLSCYGSARIKTPNIDRIASEGVRFTSFYAAGPTCTPSRAGLLSGCYPARLGFGDQLRQVGDRVSPGKVIHANSPYGLNPDAVILPELLKQSDYQTALIGKWHLGDAPEFNPVYHGFDYFFGVPYSNDMNPLYYLNGTARLPEEVKQPDLTPRLTDEATSYIKSAAGKPFFLYVAYTAPHTPLDPGPDNKGKSPRGIYGDVVEELDAGVGRILQALEDNEVADNTLVFFTSDNGPWLSRGEEGGSAYPFRAGKGTTYEGGIRVPCVARWPGVIAPGSVYDGIVTSLDFLPTFTSLAAVEHSVSVDGRDVSSVLKDVAAPSPHKYLFYYFGNELHAVRSGQWKFRARNILPNENLYGKGLPASVSVPAALYDLENDPAEQKDVKQNHPEVVAELQEAMDAMRADLGDSLTSRTPTHATPIGRRKAE